MNHRNRTASFALGFVMMGSHLRGLGSPAWVWALLAVHFLLIPHAMYWVARRAPDPLRAEVRNMLADAVLFGAWCAGLGFPLWIGFTLVICTTMNLAAFKGARGMLEVLGANLAGAAPVIAVSGWRFAPNTQGLTTALSIVCVFFYLAVFAKGAHQRTLKLAAIREQLKASQHSLQHANDELQTRLSEIGRLQAELQQQVNEDALTGLFNRRYLDITIDRELARCHREGQPLSVLLLDIDHFKQINDTHGHPTGDRVLQQAAQLFAQQARVGDVACRYGGEEFLLLLPHMPLQAAIDKAERYRQAFAGLTAGSVEHPVHATISIGVATFPGHGTDAQALIAAADRALYQAKARGRNRVEVAHN